MPPSTWKIKLKGAILGQGCKFNDYYVINSVDGIISASHKGINPDRLFQTITLISSLSIGILKNKKLAKKNRHFCDGADCRKSPEKSGLFLRFMV